MLISKRTHCFACPGGELKRATSTKDDVFWYDRCTHCDSYKITHNRTGYVEYIRRPKNHSYEL